MSRRTVGRFCILLWLVAIAGSASAAGPRSPLAWSPDGDWLAYATEAPADPSPLATSWIFDGKDADPGAAPRGVAGRRRHRLWATRIGSDASSFVLDDSPGPITPPCWRPDGKALAFGRVVPTPDGRARFEVVRLEGEERRILSTQSVDDPARDTPGLVGSPIAWSPDGRFLAVPRVRPTGLAILRAENGAVVKSIESGSLPAWAPIGGRLFYAVAAGDGRTRIECLEGHLGATRRVAELGQVEGPLLIARDGQSLVLIARSSAILEGLHAPEHVDLFRVRVEDGHKERVLSSLGAPPMVERAVVAASLAQDRDGENLFSVLALAGQPCQVVWIHPRDRSIHKPFPVLDPTLLAGDLALSPRGGTLALRVAEPGATTGLVVLCDLDSLALTPLAPDEPARDAWLALLLATSRSILRDGLPAPILGGRAIDRAVAPPIPGELETGSEALARLRRLARAARPFTVAADRGRVDVARLEARFLFDYLREDYPAALAGVDLLAAAEPTADRRLEVVGLRGMVFAGLGDFDRARDAFSYLKAIEPGRSRRVVEETSLGPVVSEPATPDAGWAEYALARIDLLSKEAAKEDADAAADHHNPDAPLPGLGLDIDPLPRPAIPEPPPGLFPRPRPRGAVLPR